MSSSANRALQRMALAFLIGVALLTGCRFGPCGAQFYAPWKEDFSGGDGSSLKHAVIIKRAVSVEQAIQKEEKFLAGRLVDTRSTMTNEGRVYHLVTTKSHGENSRYSETLYFDITKALRK